MDGGRVLEACAGGREGALQVVERAPGLLADVARNDLAGGVGRQHARGVDEVA